MVDYKTGIEFFWGGLGAVIYAVLCIVAYSLMSVAVGTIVVLGALAFLTGFYAWCLNTYDEAPLSKIVSSIMLAGVPALLFIMHWSGTDLAEDQTMASAFVVSIVALVVFLAGFVTSIVLRKTDNLERFRQVFVIMRVVFVVVALGILIFSSGDVAYQLSEVFNWILLIVFVVRALLGLRTANQFELDDEDEARAFCRKSLRAMLMDGMLLTSGFLMLTAMTYVIIFIGILIVCEIILFIVGAFAAGVSA